MTSEAVARRALCNVQAASWIVRLIFIVDMTAGVLSLYFQVGYSTGIVLVMNGSAALVHPLLLSCVFSKTPDISDKSCWTCGKYVLYVWLFVLNCALTPIFYGAFFYFHILGGYMEFEKPPVAIFLFIVAMVTCLMLTVVNMYTLCILHKNGCCFMHRLRQDVEEAAATVMYSRPYTSIGQVASAPEHIYSHMPETRLPDNRLPYSVYHKPGELGPAYDAWKQPGNNF